MPCSARVSPVGFRHRLLSLKPRRTGRHRRRFRGTPSEETNFSRCEHDVVCRFWCALRLVMDPCAEQARLDRPHAARLPEADVDARRCAARGPERRLGARGDRRGRGGADGGRGGGRDWCRAAPDGRAGPGRLGEVRAPAAFRSSSLAAAVCA